MAPRSQGVQRDAAHGAGDASRRVRNANTGAGVNSRRSTVAGDGGGSQSQRVRRTGNGVPRPQNGRASRPQGPLVYGTQNASRARVTASIVNNATSLERTASPTTTFTTPRANSSPGPRLTPFSGSRLTRIFPESQRRLDSISPAGRESSFTISPKPIRMLNNVVTKDSNSGQASDKPSPIDFISGQAYAPLPVAKARPVYRGNDPIKSLVTNSKLRAILADRPYPKERKKSGGERPVLKMGISKEYK